MRQPARFFGRVTNTNFPSSLNETYQYDADNNLTQKTDRKGQTIQYLYDALNRLTQKTYPDMTAVEYTYDLVGKVLQVNDPTGTYAFAYDNMGRLVGTTTSYSFLTSRNFTTGYTYDAASNRTGFTDPEGGTTGYSYDTLNRLTSLAPPSAFGSGSFGFSYDALSRRTQMTRPNSVTTNYAYDQLSRLTSVLHQLSGSTIDGATYTLDNAGNRTSKTDYLAGVTSNYTYDPVYELTQVTQGTNTTESYSYDAVGNRTASLGVASYTTNASNELTATSNATYTYDNNGNTTSKTDSSSNTTTYTWDYENRLTGVTLPGSGGTVTFKYDPLGRRIEKISPTTTSIFAYDGENLIETVNSTGGVVARYTQTQNVDEPLAESRSGTTSYYEQDGLGSVTSLSNTPGALAQTYTYDSFGNTTNSSGSLANFFRYTGREFDTESGLYFNRARYYDPNAGRFVSEDPEMFEAGVDFYVYALENPVAFTDPFGFDIWLEGPSGSEPAGHLSINVGDPNGAYSSYSFGVDGNGLEGMVYQDISHGGDFYPGYYRHTTPAEDALAKAHLDSLLGNTAGYRPWNTCRTFSFNQFKYFQDKGFGKPGPPPPQAKNPRNPSFNVPWYLSTTATDPAPSSSTPARRVAQPLVSRTILTFRSPYYGETVCRPQQFMSKAGSDFWGAPPFAVFAKGGSGVGSAKTVGAGRPSHPCKKRKDGAPQKSNPTPQTFRRQPTGPVRSRRAMAIKPGPPARRMGHPSKTRTRLPQKLYLGAYISD